MKTIKMAFASMFLILSSYASAVEISGNVALSSDYIWRGMTQTQGDLSVNGGFDVSTDMGFYIGTWASNAGGTGTDYSMELDVYLGFSGEMAENMTYDVGYISVIYPGDNASDFEEAYIAFNFYGLNILYSDGQNDSPDYAEVGYGIDAGPGSFSISYGDYDGMGTNYLIGYDWSVGYFTIGFAYTDFNADVAANDYDTAILTISY